MSSLADVDANERNEPVSAQVLSGAGINEPETGNQAERWGVEVDSNTG